MKILNDLAEKSLSPDEGWVGGQFFSKFKDWCKMIKTIKEPEKYPDKDFNQDLSTQNEIQNKVNMG